MAAELDSLIRKSKDLEAQIEQLTADLTRLHAAIAERMGDLGIRRNQVPRAYLHRIRHIKSWLISGEGN